MLDKFNREITYLRISVTDRCNLRCLYCMPAEGISLLKHDEILSFDEIVEICTIAIQLGINKIRITGGEPLVRKNIEYLISKISKINGLKDLSMTTNAILLDNYAQKLKDAGLMRVNISLDTLDPAEYKQITRGGDIKAVFKGIEAAQKAKLLPIKINTVITNSTTNDDKENLKLFCKENNLDIRFIKKMSLTEGSFEIVDGGTGGNCSLCNRLRLTANGSLKPCLFSNLEFKIRELGIENAIKKAIENKPLKANVCTNRDFYNIGG